MQSSYDQESTTSSQKSAFGKIKQKKENEKGKKQDMEENECVTRKRKEKQSLEHPERSLTPWYVKRSILKLRTTSLMS